MCQNAGHAIQFENATPLPAYSCNITQLSKETRQFAFVGKDMSDRVKLEDELKRYFQKQKQKTNPPPHHL